MRGLNRQYATGWAQIAHLVRDEGRSFSGRERHCVFVNTGGPRFGSASAVSGLDLADDGRASAVVDWDLDGDLDLWVTNRTGPRVRFFKNNTNSAGNFVAFRLTGTKCNRDAIGSRLELKLAGDPQPLLRTLHAGDGFLSQSSKWLHFGLGAANKIEKLTVRWPDGVEESFVDLQANRRYGLVQGSGKAEPVVVDRSSVSLAAADLPVVFPEQKTRVVLVDSAQLPDVDVENSDGAVVQLSELTNGPTLLNIWQTTCVPCLQELTDFSKREQAIRAAGLDIVALHASDPKAAADTDRQAIREMLARVKFPFAAARTVANTIERLDRFQKHTLQKHHQFAMPTSFLLDRERKVVAIYKGPIDVERLLADAQLVELNRGERLDASVPFAGKWFHSPLDDEEQD